MHDEESDVGGLKEFGVLTRCLWTALNLGAIEMASRWRERMLFGRLVVFDRRQYECS